MAFLSQVVDPVFSYTFWQLCLPDECSVFQADIYAIYGTFRLLKYWNLCQQPDCWLLSLKSHSSTFLPIRQCKKELNRQLHSRRDISRLQSILTDHWLIDDMPKELALLSIHTITAVRIQEKRKQSSTFYVNIQT